MKIAILSSMNQFEKNIEALEGDTFTVGKEPKKKTIKINQGNITDAKKTLLGNVQDRNAEEIIQELHNHLNMLLTYLPSCSTPEAFIKCWGLKNSSTVVDKDIAEVIRAGGQLLNKFDLPICKTSQQGVTLTKNLKLVVAINCTSTAYDDYLDKKNQSLSYYPPQSIRGPIRFKWIETLSTTLENSMIVLAVRWFKFNDELKFCISPTQVINQNKQTNYKSSLYEPLTLKLIHPKDAEKLIKNIQKKL